MQSQPQLMFGVREPFRLAVWRGEGESRRGLREADEGEEGEADALVHGCLFRCFVFCWALLVLVDDAIVFVMPVPRLALDMVFRSPCAADAQMLGRDLQSCDEKSMV